MTGPRFEDAREAERAILRHFLAALAYRTQKALRGAPVGYGEFRAAAGVRTPRALLRHMSDVLSYATTAFTGGTRRAQTLPTFSDEIERFHSVLEELGGLVADADLDSETSRRLLQGPLSDAMAHAGQLAMLRRLHGSPVPPENFFDARVDARNLGPDQPDPASPDAEWYDAEEEPW